MSTQREHGGGRMGHQDAWELIPWYVNDTLEEPERSAVEEHLAACAICRQEVASSRRLERHLRAAGEVPLAPERGFARLMARIDGSDDGLAEPAGSAWPGRLWRPFAAAPRPVRLALAGQLAALLALAVLALWPASPAAGPPAAAAGFRTLSDAPLASPAAAPRLRLVFAGETRASELSDLLAASGARIVDGPTPAGVYTVELAEPDDVAAVLERLRLSPTVVFAEPAATAGAP